jgi:hypothetical protein
MRKVITKGSWVIAAAVAAQCSVAAAGYTPSSVQLAEDVKPKRPNIVQLAEDVKPKRPNIVQLAEDVKPKRPNIDLA